jgi:hypothetical protein
MGYYKSLMYIILSDDQILVNNWLQLRDSDPLWVAENPESENQLPSPLGYGVIFKINSCNSSSFMELSSNFNIGLPYCAKLELKKQNMYIHDLPTLSYLEEKGHLRCR